MEEEHTGMHVLCMSLHGAAHVVQWGGSDVYKVGARSLRSAARISTIKCR